MSQPPTASAANDPVKPSRGHKKAGSGGSGGGGGHGSSMSGGVGGLHRSSGGAKSKDSSALLMSVIRSLSASSDDHQQREQEKAKLDKVRSSTPFFFIRTSKFDLRLNVLIQMLFWGSNVLKMFLFLTAFILYWFILKILQTLIIPIFCKIVRILSNWKINFSEKRGNK